MGQNKKRSVRISGHPTSISLEQEFWSELTAIAAKRSISVNQMIAEIDETRQNNNLSSAIRVYILKTLKTGPDSR